MYYLIIQIKCNIYVITIADVILFIPLQVVILLFIASWLVHWLWMRGNDPDNFSIPYLTAIGDLLGTVLLLAVFLLLYAVNDKSIDVTN